MDPGEEVNGPKEGTDLTRTSPRTEQCGPRSNREGPKMQENQDRKRESIAGARKHLVEVICLAVLALIYIGEGPNPARIALDEAMRRILWAGRELECGRFYTERLIRIVDGKEGEEDEDEGEEEE